LNFHPVICAQAAHLLLVSKYPETAREDSSMSKTTVQSVALDKYARDAETWLTYGNVIYSAARVLFDSANASPDLYFSAAPLGHSCLEVLMKGILIQEGMVSFDPRLIKRLTGAVLQEHDCVWGHSLMKLAEELERRTKFSLAEEMEHHSIVHPAPFTVRQGLELFDPFFEELRYPHGLERVESFGEGDEHILDELVSRILAMKRT
jgi:hypothetical protein